MEKSLAELKGLETLALPGSHVFLSQSYVIPQVVFSALAIRGLRYKRVVQHLEWHCSLQGVFVHYN